MRHSPRETEWIRAKPIGAHKLSEAKPSRKKDSPPGLAHIHSRQIRGSPRPVTTQSVLNNSNQPTSSSQVRTVPLFPPRTHRRTARKFLDNLHPSLFVCFAREYSSFLAIYKPRKNIHTLVSSLSTRLIRLAASQNGQENYQ
jgi:hypothetical protein